MAQISELTTLGFIVSPDRDRVLLCHRVARASDEQLGKYNGVGGKVEPGEDIWAAMMREIDEETGLKVTRMELRGTVSWPGFLDRDVFGFVFLITEFEGQPPTHNEEGTLAWHAISQLGSLPMWDGDRHFLPLVFDAQVAQFHGVLPYDGPTSAGWKATIVPTTG